MHGITVNGKFLNQEFIRQLVIQNPETFEDFTLQFYQQWLSNQSEFILTTSGSTGEPKKISLKREQLIISAQQTIQALHLKKGMNALLCLDSRFIAGKMMIVRSIEAEMSLIASNPASNPFEHLPKDQNIDFAAMVPLQIYSIIQSNHADRFNKMEVVLIGGAALDHQLRNELKKFSCRFYETYGMTETVSHIALRDAKDENQPFTILPGITISLDERGCLIIKGKHILNEEVVTNDIIELVGSNQFHWIGRWDNVINSGGIKISPEKLEDKMNLLFEKAGINNRFFIIGMPHQELGAAVSLVLEGKVNLEVLKGVQQQLDRYERPKLIYSVNEFVITPTGKINRPETIKKTLTPLS